MLFRYRMEETTPLSSSRSKSVLVLSVVLLLVKGVECGELVVSSPPPPVRRTEEGEELVSGTELTGRQNSPPQTVLMWSEGGEEQGEERGRAWQHDLPFKVEDNICSDPPLEVDTEVEPQTVAVQESGP